MSLTTYAGLQASVASWITRADTATNVATWITMAEARISRELRVDDMIVRTTATLSGEFGTVPTDFLAARSLRMTAAPRIFLRYLTQEQMATQQQAAPYAGQVQAYSRVGREFWFFPAPPDASLVELIYYASIPALSDTNPSNWLLVRHPDLYLRATMFEAGLFYEDQQLVSTYSQLYSDSIGAIEAADRRDTYAANLQASPSAFVV